jgi:hypothetical protein
VKGKLVLGAAVGSAAVAATVGTRRVLAWWRTWGVDPAEAALALPGDDLVADAGANDTRGITIDAPPEAVWPWLLQMGYGRAGWYSWDRLDMKGDSADRILAEHQSLAVGDTVPTDPSGGFLVKVLEPSESLVLYVDAEITAQRRRTGAAGEPVPVGLAASGRFMETATPPDFAASWAFVLRPLDGGRTRLIERVRARMGGPAKGPAFLGSMLGFGVFVMTQKQMTGIRARAERESGRAMPYATAS